MTWAEFHDLFMGKYFRILRDMRRPQEFLELKQGAMTVIEYVARFWELAALLMTTWSRTWPRLEDSRMG